MRIRLRELMARKHTIVALYFCLFCLMALILITTWHIDRRLTCEGDVQEIAEIETYMEAYMMGSSYNSKGEARGFLTLYKWQSAKVLDCYHLAAESYSRALALNPGRLDALTNRAAAYASLGLYDKALNDHLTVLEINPEHETVRLSLAVTYEKSGQLETAVLQYEEAIAFMENSVYWQQLQPDTIDRYRARLNRLRQSLEE